VRNTESDNQIYRIIKFTVLKNVYMRKKYVKDVSLLILDPLSLSLSLSVSLHFNGHFTGEPGLAGVN